MGDHSTNSSRGTSESYHHGNLRQSLLQAALKIVESKGLEGFTLREAARVAQVSHNAPYRHFSSRADLLVKLAIEGQQLLLKQLKVQTIPKRSPEKRILALGTAYMEFAVTQTGYYRVMFSRDVMANRTEALETAQDATYDFLIAELKVGEDAGLLKGNAVERHTLAGWSLLHGAAMLVLDGHFDDTEIVAHRNPEQLARIVLETLLSGMSAERTPTRSN
ncbi:MAG: TetR/AcrR family transcriptional regulator [Planctomycetaceae bacterium]|nr:TetR/AcrR family transcriptional regulator [Planctomycetaceae bacterium]